MFSNFCHVVSLENFKLDNCIKDIMLDVDTAIPLGLVVNELTTNAFKYALINSDDKEIKICLEEITTGEFKLTFKDNGKGLPEDLDWKKIKSLGLLLIRRLSKQLHGQLNYYFSNGAVFEVSFKDSIRRANVD
ncbi:MAG: sensor histidine kinase [Flavobacteriales bacterium]|nr:sensor histidine kinase [Flavobacteriales bacterium]